MRTNVNRERMGANKPNECEYEIDFGKINSYNRKDLLYKCGFHYSIRASSVLIRVIRTLPYC
jgi:hypothetical protein